MIFENKMWYKNIKDMIIYIEKSLEKGCFFIDTETTGLKGSKHEQLTQISSIYSTYNNGRFKNIEIFNKKIKLTIQTKGRMENEEDRKQLKWVLSFNHYGDSNTKYYEEQKVLLEFKKWINNTCNNGVLIIQNASFDMDMLNGRYDKILDNEVIDTKILLQLYYIPILQKLSENDTNYKNILNNIGTSIRDNGLVSSSLSKIGPHMGLDMTNYHDGLKDCELTISMLENIIKLMKDNDDLDINKYQIERIKTYRN